MATNNNMLTSYSEVNGIQLYYEIHGSGDPLVLLHGGGSTIESSFGRILPALARNYKVIAVELQNHGRSGNRTEPQTFEQDADDVATLLKNIGINKASFFGFSNGGTTSLQIAIRHPELVSKLFLVACVFKRNGFINGFFEGMKGAAIDQMPGLLHSAFLDVNADKDKLQIMFEKDRDRMIAFTDIDENLIKNINAPTLIINADQDVVTPEHAMEIFRLIKGSQLAIIPGFHGRCIGEITMAGDYNHEIKFVVSMVHHFLNND